MNKKELAEQILEKHMNEHMEPGHFGDSNHPISFKEWVNHSFFGKSAIAAIIEAMGEKPEAEAEKGVEQLVEQMSYKFHNKHWFTDIEWESIKAFGVEVCKTALRELNSMNRAASNAVNQNFSRVLQQAHDMLFVLEMLCKDDDWQVYDAVDEDFKNLRDLAKKAIKKQSVEAMGVQPGMSECDSPDDFWVECNVCKQQLKNWTGSTPCCGSIAYIVIDGKPTTKISLFASVGGGPIKPTTVDLKPAQRYTADNQEAIEPNGE